MIGISNGGDMIQGEIPCGREIVTPREGKHRSTKTLGDGDGVVCGARVNHKDVVGERRNSRK